MALPPDLAALSAWFAGPKAENGEWFGEMIRRIIDDCYAWRRNYFPEDGVVVDTALKRHCEAFHDAFQDRLIELLGRLKHDLPIQSPRYAGHMLAEQTLPSIAGYFAAMLYNPNNVSADAAPVTVRLEREASGMIARMLGYGPRSWSHLCSGGTVANIEAMWIARTVKYLPLVIDDMRRAGGLEPLHTGGGREGALRAIGASPTRTLAALEDCFTQAEARGGPDAAQRLVRAYLDSPLCVVERGVHDVVSAIGSAPAVLVPETHHYCFEKAMDALGLGRRSLVPVRVDRDFRMIVSDLEAQIRAVEAGGRHVLAVVPVVGSTEEGAVDPVDQILDLRAKREAAGLSSFWVHADAAYGGYLRTMTVPSRMGLGDARATVRIDGVDRTMPITLPEASVCDALERTGECDSITIDPHKLGYVPYPAGAVCFRSDLVKPLARQDAPYLESDAGDVEQERNSSSIGLYILEGSKPGAAAAGVWLSHMLIPLDATGHGRLIKETVRNACELHSLLEAYPKLAARTPTVRAVPLCAPGSNIVCYAFRPVRAGATLEQINEANTRIYKQFSLEPGQRIYEQQFFVSRTTITAARYGPDSVGGFLSALGCSQSEFEREGAFLLRSVLMNPWYEHAKQRGRHFLSELVAELYRCAEGEFAMHETTR